MEVLECSKLVVDEKKGNQIDQVICDGTHSHFSPLLHLIGSLHRSILCQPRGGLSCSSDAMTPWDYVVDKGLP